MTSENSTPAPRPGFIRKGPRALGQASDGAAKDIFARNGFNNPQIILRWREFAGPVLGRLTAPITLNQQGQLTISADPSVAVFLQHQTHQLIQRVNLALGGQAVAKIKVISGKFNPAKGPRGRPPLTAQQRTWAAQTATGVSDPALKNALLRLAEAVAAETGAAASAAPLRRKP
jgi:hypothetical protein